MEMSLYRRCWEIGLEALAITLLFSFLFALGAASGSAIKWFGAMMHSDLTWLAGVIKTIIFIFDAVVVLLLSMFVLRRHYKDLRGLK